jgi:hypothetical protein
VAGSRVPEVTTGYRGPKGEFTERPKIAPGLPSIPEGKRVFQAIAGRYRLQLTAPQAIRLQDGRIIDSEKPIAVQFDEHIRVYDVKADAKVIEMIENHRDFGKDFWDLATKLEQAKMQKLQAALEYIQGADEEQKAIMLQVLQATGTDDFELPKKQ